jgi:hypothetical protein
MNGGKEGFDLGRTAKLGNEKIRVLDFHHCFRKNRAPYCTYGNLNSSLGVLKEKSVQHKSPMLVRN